MSWFGNLGGGEGPKARCGGGRQTLEGDREEENCLSVAGQEWHQAGGNREPPAEGPCQPGKPELLPSAPILATWGSGVQSPGKNGDSTKPLPSHRLRVQPELCPIPRGKGKIPPGRQEGKQETPILHLVVRGWGWGGRRGVCTGETSQDVGLWGVVRRSSPHVSADGGLRDPSVLPLPKHTAAGSQAGQGFLCPVRYFLFSLTGFLQPQTQGSKSVHTPSLAASISHPLPL